MNKLKFLLGMAALLLLCGASRGTEWKRMPVGPADPEGDYQEVLPEFAQSAEQAGSPFTRGLGLPGSGLNQGGQPELAEHIRWLQPTRNDGYAERRSRLDRRNRFDRNDSLRQQDDYGRRAADDRFYRDRDDAGNPNRDDRRDGARDRSRDSRGSDPTDATKQKDNQDYRWNFPVMRRIGRLWGRD